MIFILSCQASSIRALHTGGDLHANFGSYPLRNTIFDTGEGNKIDLFSSLDKWLDKFLSCQKIFIAASSNGFLLCSLRSDDPLTYYLVNPVTMEWVALPKLRAALPTPNRSLSHAVGFVCKGDYPSLDLVDYTIVIVSFRQGFMINPELLFKFFSSGDNQWREYRCSCPSLVRLTMIATHHNPVIVRTATNSDDQGGGIVVYFLVTVMPTMATAIVVFDLNKGDNLLQMIETHQDRKWNSVIDVMII